jgi:hypothetical protein
VANPREERQGLGPLQTIGDGLRFLRPHPGITVAIHQQGRPLDMGRGLGRPVGESVEACFHASPEHQQLGQRKGRNAPASEAVAHRRDQAVEGAFETSSASKNPMVVSFPPEPPEP